MPDQGYRLRSTPSEQAGRITPDMQAKPDAEARHFLKQAARVQQQRQRTHDLPPRVTGWQTSSLRNMYEGAREKLEDESRDRLQNGALSKRLFRFCLGAQGEDSRRMFHRQFSELHRNLPPTHQDRDKVLQAANSFAPPGENHG